MADDVPPVAASAGSLATGRGAPLAVAHCHCSSYRKRTPVRRLRHSSVSSGKVGSRRATARSESSPGSAEGSARVAARGLLRATAPATIAPVRLHVDDPQNFVPTGHVFHAERVPWLEIHDALPRFDGGSGVINSWGPEIALSAAVGTSLNVRLCPRARPAATRARVPPDVQHDLVGAAGNAARRCHIGHLQQTAASATSGSSIAPDISTGPCRTTPCPEFSVRRPLCRWSFPVPASGRATAPIIVR